MNDDSRKLLKECDAGTRMAVESLDQMLPSVHSSEFRSMLEKYKNAHESFGDKLHGLLNKQGKTAGDLPPATKLSARLMTGMKLMLDDSNKQIASMLTDGCNMGIKSLGKYLNQYQAAEHEYRQIAEHIIELEEHMMNELRPYL